MKIIKKYQNPASRLTVESDNTTVGKPIITNLPIGDDLHSIVKRAEAFNKAITDAEKYALPYPMNLTPEEKFYMDLALIGADENERLEIFKRYYNTPAIGPENIAAKTGHIQVDPITGDIVGYTPPTVKVNNLPGAWEQMVKRALNSPAFQLAWTPMLDIPMFYKGLNSKILANGIERSKGLKGELRLSLPSHTKASPRQLVLEPAGNNKFKPHVRIWNGEHIPGVISNQDKTTLYEAMYDALPEGAELLFPLSGLDYLGTRGTVAGLLRLGRDSRFTPGSKGILYYADKDGTIKTFAGTSFIKSPRIVKKSYSTPTVDVYSTTDFIQTEDPIYRIKDLPGHHLKSLSYGNPLATSISQSGLIPRKVLEDYIATTSPMELDLMNRVLNSKQFENLLEIDYNTFRKAAQQALPQISSDIFFLDLKDAGRFGNFGWIPTNDPKTIHMNYYKLFNPTYTDDRVAIMRSKLTEARIRAALKSLPKPTNYERDMFKYNRSSLNPLVHQYLTMELELSKLRLTLGGIDYLLLKHLDLEHYHRALLEILKYASLNFKALRMFVSDPKLTLAIRNNWLEFPFREEVSFLGDKATKGLSLHIPKGYKAFELLFKKGGKV